MDNVRNGLTKDWLVTDECDPAENGCRGGSKSMENNMPSGAVREGQCPSFEECHVTSAAEELDLKKNSSLPKSIESCYPFEIEPGHFDFLQVADTYSRLPKTTGCSFQATLVQPKAVQLRVILALQ